MLVMLYSTPNKPPSWSRVSQLPLVVWDYSAGPRTTVVFRGRRHSNVFPDSFPVVLSDFLFDPSQLLSLSRAGNGRALSILTARGGGLTMDLVYDDQVSEIEQIIPLIGQRMTNANLFHLAALVCFKSRWRELVDREADRVTETALATYVVSADPERMDHGLESKPLLAFAVCYLTVMGWVVVITNGKLDFGPWEQAFYGEFDRRRPKRVLVKVIGG
jgi:Uncharacterised protein family UPF0047